MESKKGFIIVSLIVIALLGVIYFTTKGTIREVNINNIETIIKKQDHSIVYVGKLDDQVKANFREFKELHSINCYHSDMTLDEVNSLITNEKDKVKDGDVYLIYLEGDLEAVLSSKLNYKELLEQIEKYYYNKIPESERNYKEISSGEYISKVNSKDYTVAVFGASSCSYCTLYLPVVNEVAGKDKVDIYYFDKDKMDEDKYEDIMDLNLEIPAECNLNGYTSKMSDGFPKPMTFITKKNKIVGCIRGYVTEEVLENKLKEFNLIKE